MEDKICQKCLAAGGSLEVSPLMQQLRLNLDWFDEAAESRTKRLPKTNAAKFIM